MEQDIILLVSEKIFDAYEKLKQLPKPESYRIGGTYYGSTQLYSSVGNMLDLIEGGSYTSYSYSSRTNYSELYGVRIGGAYSGDSVREIKNELRDFIKEHRQEIFDAGWAIIDDFGTNFSVIGVAWR